MWVRYKDFAIAFAIVFAVVLAIVIAVRQKIRIMIAIIQESTNAMMKMPFLVFVPWFYAIQIAVLVRSDAPGSDSQCLHALLGGGGGAGPRSNVYGSRASTVEALGP